VQGGVMRQSVKGQGRGMTGVKARVMSAKGQDSSLACVCIMTADWCVW